MRRLISLVSALVALTALGLVLYNATVVDRKPPSITRISLSAPSGSDDRLAQTLTAIDIQFSEAVRTSTVESRFRIEPYVAGAFSWDGTTAIFTPSAKLPQDTQFTISIESGYEDLAGNVAEIAPEPWAFQTVGSPLVVASTPVQGASGVAVRGTTIDLTFDRLMDTASVEAALRVEPTAPFTASWSGEVVRLAFGGVLSYGTDYTVTVGSDAADTSGNRLRDPFRLTFSTAAAGLAIVGTVPVDGVAGIGVRTPIAIRFDAPVDADTARAAFRITPSVSGDLQVVAIADDRDLAGTAVPREPDTLVFTPGGPLAAHTTYTVTLDSTVQRADDPQTVAAGLNWSFTTGSPTASGQNQIAFLSDRSGVRNVWLMNPDGTNQRQLTTGLNPVAGFDVTGDGSRVAYSSGGKVDVIGIDGENDRRVTADGAFEYAAAFTPDDRRLLLARRAADGTDLGYWLVPLDGTAGGERQVLDHGAPRPGSASLAGQGLVSGDGTPAWWARAAFDPDGTVAVVATADGETYLLHLVADDAVPTNLQLTSSVPPTWWPRRSGFVVVHDEGTQSAMRLVDPSGTTEALEASDPRSSVGVATNGSLVYSVADGAARQLVVLPPAAATPNPLEVDAGPRIDRWPSFSPDGSIVIFSRSPGDAPESSAGIWSIRLGDRTATQLTIDGAYPRWLP